MFKVLLNIVKKLLLNTWMRRSRLKISKFEYFKNRLSDSLEEYYFDGMCMIPMQSWNAQMELEHWNRYITFFYLAESKNVLDVACGEGYGTNLLSLIASKAIGIDLSIKNINHANDKYASGKCNLEYIVEDACDISIKNCMIDVIYSFETIEHLKDIPGFLSSLSRIISDHGVGVISTPRPNVSLIYKRPSNPHHIHELSASKFKGYLSEYFSNVAMAGQSKDFPYEIHRDFNRDKDAYMIGIVSNDGNAVKRIVCRLPLREVISIREELYIRYFNRIKNFSKSLRILFIPLTNTNCDNPSDKRRILLPANFLREYGAEVAIVNKEDAINIPSDIIYSQDREYSFWLDNIKTLKNNGRHLIFSFSDALCIGLPSKAHNFKSFCSDRKSKDTFTIHKNLKSFLERCCSHVFAGSDVQKEIVSNMTTDVPISVLPDPIDTEIYNASLVNRDKSQKNKKFTLIWEGFYDNVPYLLVCAKAVKHLSKKIPLKVIVATSKNRRNKFFGTTDNEELARKILGGIAEFHIWDKETISELMAKSDVGLAPLFMECQFARAKPANKAVIYNYMKLPVIASPSIGYKSYIQHGLNGFIANTEADWEKYILYLYKNSKERERIGKNGHKKAKLNYSINVISQQILHIFQLLCNSTSV
jgi:glycosyltransferase involved in cell wall biosynthesis